MACEILPQGSNHEGLDELVVGEEVVDLLARHQLDGQLLGGIEMRRGHRLHIGG